MAVIAAAGGFDGVISVSCTTRPLLHRATVGVAVLWPLSCTLGCGFTRPPTPSKFTGSGPDRVRGFVLSSSMLLWGWLSQCAYANFWLIALLHLLLDVYWCRGGSTAIGGAVLAEVVRIAESMFGLFAG